MSLILYLHEEDIPDNVKLCKSNDLFFDGSTLLRNTDLCSRVLMVIDLSLICI